MNIITNALLVTAAIAGNFASATPNPMHSIHSKKSFMSIVQATSTKVDKVAATPELRGRDLTTGGTGYAVASFYSSSTCGGSPSMLYGMITGSCFGTDTGSMSATCSDANGVIAYNYTTDDCSGDADTESMVAVGPCTAFTDTDGTTGYVSTACTTDMTPWQSTVTGVAFLYYNLTTECTSGEDVTEFATIAQGVCSDDFMISGCSSAGFPVTNCAGVPFLTVPLETCQANDDGGGDDDSDDDAGNIVSSMCVSSAPNSIPKPMMGMVAGVVVAAVMLMGSA
jgi:hypothetical protein